MKKNDSNIKKAIKYLNNNECIAIPTETVYGLAGNAYSDRAVSKVYKLKKRPSNNPLIVHYYSCLLYTSPSPGDLARSRMPSSA